MDFWNIANASVHQADQCLNLDHIYPEEIELHIRRLQQIQRAIRDLQNATDNLDDASAWLEGIESLLILLRERRTAVNIPSASTHDNHPASNIRQQDDYTGQRPFIHLDMANVHRLLQIRYTQQEIADLVGIFTKTLQHRLVVKLAMTLNEDEIDEVMQQLVAQFPSAGQR